MHDALVLQLHLWSLFAMIESGESLMRLSPSGPCPDEGGMALSCEYELGDQPPDFRCGEDILKE